MTFRAPATLVLTAVIALGLAACGDDDNPDTSAAATTTTASAADTTTSTGAPVAATTVAVRKTTLGEVLVNGEGLTLYAFDNDKDGAPTCIGGCSTAWPAMLVDGDVTAGEGLDAADFDTVANPDGGMQLTASGKPLYLFSGDSAAGDVNGQGVGNVWHAVAADGTEITSVTPTTAADASSVRGY